MIQAVEMYTGRQTDHYCSFCLMFRAWTSIGQDRQRDLPSIAAFANAAVQIRATRYIILNKISGVYSFAETVWRNGVGLGIKRSRVRNSLEPTSFSYGQEN